MKTIKTKHGGCFPEDWECHYTAGKARFSKALTKSFGATHHRGRNPGIQDGGLAGSTDTDYFYFLCPKCRGVVQWHLLFFVSGPSHHKEKEEKNRPAEHLQFELWCSACKLGGKVKMNNDCWQGGHHVKLAEQETGN